MAKDLPYFKFFCSEWSDGDITLESYEAQGLFINICAYYWSNECVIELSKLKKKFKGFEAIIDEMISSKILKTKGLYVSISFLDEQKIERELKSRQNSENITKYWERKRTLNENDTNVLNPNNESDSIKRREEERREEENNKPMVFSFFNSLIGLGANKELVNDWLKVRKNKRATNTETAFKRFIKQYELSGYSLNDVLEKCIEKSWSGFEADWYKKNNTVSGPIGKTNQKIMTYDD